MRIIFILVVIFLSACTTVTKNMKLVTEGHDTASLLVYRPAAFQAGAVSLYIGKNSKYFMALGNNQYAKVKIDSGKHLLQAKASGSPSSELEIVLLPNSTNCIKSSPNKAMLGAIIIPLVANMVPTFELEEVECPKATYLEKFLLVKSP